MQAPTELLAIDMRDVTIASMRDAQQHVLEGVNWQVRIGEYWAVGGLQASGKSDLLSTVAGLLAPLSGTYLAFGQTLSVGFEHERVAARLKIGMVFDGGRPFKHLTVAENVALPLRYHLQVSAAELEEQVGALLEFTEMTRHANLYPANMALNWQQRIGLARALALKPETLLLDNPLTGLDPVHTAWWLTILDKLSAGHPILGSRPLTLVATGDDLRPWKGHAHRFAALKDKRLVPLDTAAGTALPDDVLLKELLGH